MPNAYIPKDEIHMTVAGKTHELLQDSFLWVDGLINWLIRRVTGAVTVAYVPKTLLHT